MAANQPFPCAEPRPALRRTALGGGHVTEQPLHASFRAEGGGGDDDDDDDDDDIPNFDL